MDLDRVLRLGSWRIVRRLGEDARHALLLLQHVHGGRLAVAKVLIAEGGGASLRTIRFRLEQERRAAAADSEGVLAPLDIGKLPDGSWYLVLEHMEGRPMLEEVQASGPLPVNRVIEIGSRLAATLAETHVAGIFHGDLQPLDVILGAGAGEGTFQVKLFDFGSGSDVERPVEAAQAGEPTGTPGYMCPEAWAGEEPTGAFDVFSLGVVLFQLLTGRLPFPLSDKSVTQTMLNLLDGEVPDIDPLRTEPLDSVPAALEHVIRRTLAKRASDRPTMAAVRDLLACCLIEDEDDIGVPALVLEDVRPRAASSPVPTPVERALSGARLLPAPPQGESIPLAEPSPRAARAPTPAPVWVGLAGASPLEILPRGSRSPAPAPWTGSGGLPLLDPALRPSRQPTPAPLWSGLPTVAQSESAARAARTPAAPPLRSAVPSSLSSERSVAMRRPALPPAYTANAMLGTLTLRALRSRVRRPALLSIASALVLAVSTIGIVWLRTDTRRPPARTPSVESPASAPPRASAAEPEAAVPPPPPAPAEAKTAHTRPSEPLRRTRRTARTTPLPTK